IKNGDSFQASETISQIEEQLRNGSFYRTHRSYLLNMLFISTYRKADKKITIRNSDVEIPVARDKVKSFELTLRTVFLRN
ncbi:MAG: LytTR family transcriptional regulator DNA-binding domain-containing protein, partial [Bacteroidia bacterium]|nr:LytTR family transcriptional regulator DNA-binding domain-containing protein [Bacteroidia bacterium]